MGRPLTELMTIGANLALALCRRELDWAVNVASCSPLIWVASSLRGHFLSSAVAFRGRCSGHVEALHTWRRRPRKCQEGALFLVEHIKQREGWDEVVGHARGAREACVVASSPDRGTKMGSVVLGNAIISGEGYKY